jgi:hypothetical protein
MNQYRALIAREEDGRMVVHRRFTLRANTIDDAAKIAKEHIDPSVEVPVHIKLKSDEEKRH